MNKDSHLIAEQYQTMCEVAGVTNFLNLLNTGLNTLGNIAGNIAGVASATGQAANAATNAYNTFSGNEAGQSSTPVPTNDRKTSEQKETWRKYATAIAGVNNADPDLPANSLTLPHNQMMMKAFEVAEKKGINPEQLARMVRPKLQRAVAASTALMNQFKNQTPQQIAQAVSNDPQVLRHITNAYEQTLQEIQ